jgi:pyrroline-5-carboxylate reductase
LKKNFFENMNLKNNFFIIVLISLSGVPASQVTVSAPSDRNLGKWKEAGAKTTHQNGMVIENSRVVILALKPQQFQGPWQGASRPDGNLFISVMAGMSTKSVETILEARCSKIQPAVVRTMPNTPIMVGQGATVLCPGQFASDWDLKISKLIFGGEYSILN